MKTFLLSAGAIVLILGAGYGGRQLGYMQFHDGENELRRVTNALHQVTDQLHTLEADGTSSSPIIVGSSSIHFREEGRDLAMLDDQHIYFDLHNHAAVDVRMGWCPNNQPANPTNCTFGAAQPPGSTALSPTLKAPWSLQLLDSAAVSVGTMRAADANLPGFIMITPTDYTHEFGRDGDDGYNGWGYQILDCTSAGIGCLSHPLPLLTAVLTANNATYNLSCAGTAPTGQPLCTIYIRYCTPTASCT